MNTMKLMVMFMVMTITVMTLDILMTTVNYITQDNFLKRTIIQKL
jgi:hypothetical protein